MALILLAVASGMAQGTDDPRYVRAFSTLYTTAQPDDLVKAWCDARAPETRAETDTALAAWKTTCRLYDIESRADSVLGAPLPATRAGVSARRESVFRALDKDSKGPATDCRQMLAYLNRSTYPQRLQPLELVWSRTSARAPWRPHRRQQAHPRRSRLRGKVMQRPCGVAERSTPSRD